MWIFIYNKITVFRSLYGRQGGIPWSSLTVVLLLAACSSSPSPQIPPDLSPTSYPTAQAPILVCDSNGLMQPHQLSDRLNGRRWTATLAEARAALPGLREPTRLPNGFELSTVEIQGSKDKDSPTAPYHPCRIALRYTPPDLPYPWIELQQPGCLPWGRPAS